MLCHELPPVGGGAASVCRTLVERHAAAGVRVTVVTMGWDALPAEERPAPGVVVVRLPCGRRRRTAASPVEALRWTRRAGRWVRRRHAADPFDVAHAHFVAPAGLVAARLAADRRRPLPFVLTVHGSDVPGHNPYRFVHLHRWIRPFWRRICHAAATVVSPSEELRDLLRAAGVGEVAVIPNPVDERRFRSAVKEPRILLCGRLIEGKGFDPLLAALRGVDLDGWEVDVVGEGPQRAGLERRAADLRLPVRFHGWIGHDDPRLADVFARAAVFAFPSRRENLPLALLEAMAAGCAVVACDVPGSRDVVADAGRLVPVDDGPALAAAVRELAADATVREELGRRARERAAGRFGSARIAGLYLDRLTAAAAAGR